MVYFLIIVFLLLIIGIGLLPMILQIISNNPNKLYKIDFGYLIPSDFTIIRARSVDKAVKKFERKHPTARIYGIERMEEF